MNWNEWLAGFAGASPLEWLATLSGFICVYLLIKRNIWCFLFGLIQVSLYTWIFFQVRLYSDMLLHVIYIGFQIYGYLIWSSSMEDRQHVSVDTGSVTGYAASILVVITSSALVGALMSRYTDASLPYYDAFTTCASLAAQWLLSHRKMFNWSFWIVVDVVAIWIYWQKGLYPTSVLYCCFLVMATIGQWQWWQHAKSHRATAVPE